MQVPRKHFPIVGLLGLVVVAAAGGGIYYYQFVLPHATVTYTASHRLVFMTAIVQEEGGFHVTNTAFLNQTNLPEFNASAGVNFAGFKTGLNYTNYQGESDNKTIDAHVGDTVTFYIYGKNATSPCGSYSDGGIKECWLSSCNAHGFDIINTSGSGGLQVDNGTLGGTCSSPSSAYIPFGKWYSVTVTFTAPGTYSYFCTIVCSNEHTGMNGNIVVS
jgi:plastocyanin